MDFEAHVLKDSVNPSGSRLTTMSLTYPRCIHSEFMTHRQFSRNAASSRAIPVKKMLEQVLHHPFIPIHWGANEKGMQAAQVLSEDSQAECVSEWLQARTNAVESARALMEEGLHKQIANRLLEPFMWITVICSGVDHAWENFFKLRCHEAAEPHIQKIAYMAQERLAASTPTPLKWNDHHLPLCNFPGDDELHEDHKVAVSIARCARVSYLTHDGRRDIAADLALHTRLYQAGHWSPFEHVAKASPSDGLRGGNFGVGWVQQRKLYQTEYVKPMRELYDPGL